MRKDQKREIKLIIEECCSRGVFPGANVAILLEDEEYLFSVGKKSILPKEELNSIDTIYDIASLTKVLVTTTLIMKLIDMGKLKLILDIIPSFWLLREPSLCYPVKSSIGVNTCHGQNTSQTEQAKQLYCSR